jgi:hypothetical protein
MRKALWWKRLALVAGLALGVYVVVEIVLAGGGTPPLPPNQAPIDLRGGHVLNNHIATKSWSFDYDHARLSPDGLSGSVDGVRNGIVFRKGKPYLRISAKHVVLNIQSLDFTAVGKVHIERINDPEHRAFDTDLVTWTNDAKILRPLTFTRAGRRCGSTVSPSTSTKTPSTSERSAEASTSRTKCVR